MTDNEAKEAAAWVASMAEPDGTLTRALGASVFCRRGADVWAVLHGIFYSSQLRALADHMDKMEGGAS